MTTFASTDVLAAAAALGYPTTIDAGLDLAPAATRMLPADADAVAVRHHDGVLEVLVDHLPSAAEVLSYERVTGCAVTVTVTTPEVYTTVATRARTEVSLDDITSLLSTLGPEVDSVHLLPGQPPLARVAGQLGAAEQWRPLTAADIDTARTFLLPDTVDEATVTWSGRRWNVRVRSAGGSPTLTLHAAAAAELTLTDLSLPGAVADVADLPGGLVLLASRPGHGRSSTLAGILDRATTHRPLQVTLVTASPAPPTRQRRSVVLTRTAGLDVTSVADAATQAVSDRTELLAVDVDTYTHADVTALTRAALAGVLVVVTLPAGTVTEALAAFLTDVPDSHYPSVLTALAAAYQVGVAQRLVAAVGGGQVPATELWWATPSLRTALAAGAFAQLPGAARHGGGRRANVTMAEAVDALVASARVHA